MKDTKKWREETVEALEGKSISSITGACIRADEEGIDALVCRRDIKLGRRGAEKIADIIEDTVEEDRRKHPDEWKQIERAYRRMND